MKNLVWVGCSLVFITISLIYWSNTNSNRIVTDLNVEIGHLIQASNKESYDSRLTQAENLKIRLASASLVTDTIRKSYANNFLTVWQKKNMEPADTVQLIQRFKRFFVPVLVNAWSVKNNQLIGMIAISILFSLLLWLAMFTPLLRDAVTDEIRLKWKQKPVPAGNPVTYDASYSLARTQLAIWIGIIASFYIYSYLWNLCDKVTLNQTALILMGISAGTFAAGAIVDTTEMQQGIPRSQDAPSSGNFLKDILSDNNGISIHRFQNLVWTVIAIIIYFYRYNNPLPNQGCLPDLDNTLLALTGISSATYLTLKTRESVGAGEIIKQLSIQLLPPAGLGVAGLKLTNASVSLQDKAGAAPVAATLAQSAALFDFTVVNVKSGSYTITASWNGTDATGKALSYTGSVSLAFDGTTPMPLKVQLQ